MHKKIIAVATASVVLAALSGCKSIREPSFLHFKLLPNVLDDRACPENGHCVVQRAGGSYEGPRVDGKRHGHWVFRGKDGTELEGPMVYGKMLGRWVVREPDGTVSEGEVSGGLKHGHWVFRYTDGVVAEGPMLGESEARSLGYSVSERNRGGGPYGGGQAARPVGLPTPGWASAERLLQKRQGFKLSLRSLSPL